MTLTPVSSTEVVLDHHLSCFGTADMDGILADYTPDAVMITPSGVMRGPEAMRPAFDAMFREFAKPGAKFDMHTKTVEGEFAFIVWSAETADNIYDFATDTFVVRNGKIVAQTFAPKTTSRA